MSVPATLPRGPRGLGRTSAWLGVVLSLLLVASANAAVRVGDAVPAFALPDAAGRPVAIERFRGRVVVLDFTASWCVACREALPALERLGARYADRGVVVVTIAIDADRADADRFLADVVPGHGMTILYDTSARMLARFGAAGMPAHYVLDRDGVVRFAASGYTPKRADEIAAAVETVLEATPTP